MAYFSGKQNPKDWLSLGYVMMKETKESPRLAAMQRMRAKRAALKARAADQEEESQQGDQRSSMARKTAVEVQQVQPVLQPPPLQAPPRPQSPSVIENHSLLAPQPPPSHPSLALAPPGPPPSALPPRPITRVFRMRRPTITLQLFPEKDSTPLYRSNIIGVRRTWVTRANGERMGGLMRWSETVDDVIIICDCHNLMFSPEGFLNHAGLKGMSMDRPLRHIIVSMDPVSLKNKKMNEQAARDL